MVCKNECLGSDRGSGGVSLRFMLVDSQRKREEREFECCAQWQECVVWWCQKQAARQKSSTSFRGPGWKEFNEPGRFPVP